jgi:hypothetical protein
MVKCWYAGHDAAARNPPLQLHAVNRHRPIARGRGWGQTLVLGPALHGMCGQASGIVGFPGRKSDRGPAPNRITCRD